MSLTPDQIRTLNNRLYTKITFEGYLSDVDNNEKFAKISEEWYNEAIQIELEQDADATLQDEFNDKLRKEAAINAGQVLDRYIKTLTKTGRISEIKQVEGPGINADQVAGEIVNAIGLGLPKAIIKAEELIEQYRSEQKTEEQKAAKAKENRLSEQAALMLSLKELLAKIPSSANGATINVKEKVYKNFAPIRYDGDQSDGEKKTPVGHFFLTNNFTKTPRMSTFFKNLPPQVLSFLVPSIKLYKTFFPIPREDVDKKLSADFKNIVGYDWRIPFDDIPVQYGNQTSEFVVSNVDAILSGQGNLRSAGIKSFSYEYKGVNPAEINTNIHASIELFFQNPSTFVETKTINFNDPRFVKSPPNNKTFQTVKFSYSDLINSVSRTKGTNGEIFNEEYYRLKVECGYADIQPDIIKDTLINSGTPVEKIDSIIAAIKETKVVLNLTPYNYNINFNEDSTVTIKIDFIAAMDTMMASPEADLFAITEETKYLRELLNKYELFVSNKEKGISDIEKRGKCKSPEELKKDIEEFKNKYPELAGITQEQLEEKLNLARRAIYNGIFNFLIGKEDLYKGNPQKTIKPKIYFAYFKPDILGVSANNTNESVAQRVNALKAGDNLRKVEGLFSDEEVRSTPTLVDFPTSEEKSAISDIWSSVAGASSASLPQNTDEELYKSLDERTAQSFNSGENVYRIKFVLLGDILDIALECLNSIQPSFESPRVAIGNIPIAVPTAKTLAQDGFNIVTELEPLYPNLADIPISFNLFQEFMIEHIVKPKKDRYPIIQFIKDIISDLIIPAISPSVFGQSSAINSSIRFSTSYFTFPTFEGADALTGREALQKNYPPPINENVFKRLKDIRDGKGFKTDVEMTKSENGSGKDTLPKFVNYLFLVCTSRFPNNLDGDENNDLENGVLHFRMGTETGLIKKINFQKSDAPYLREVVARREGNAKGTTIKQVYKASVELFGNNIFRPGDYVYIHPNYMFNSKQLIDLEDKLGIGGYYLVLDVKTDMTEGSYNTKLTCAFQAHVEKEKNKKAVVVPLNDDCVTK